MLIKSLASALLATAALALSPTQSSAARTPCGFSTCAIQLTAAQMLTTAESLVRDKHYIEAKPILNALGALPQYDMQVGFLRGYIAVESGDLKTAMHQFRRILLNHPDQTRVRLELARAQQLAGNDAAAEHNFRLAAQDKSLPPEILATITSSRNLLRDRRVWGFNLDFGLAPDTNINNGSTSPTVDGNLGNTIIPLKLGTQQLKQSGIGEQAAASGTLRLPFAKNTKLLIEGDTGYTHYQNGAFNDFNAQIAAGPEFKLSPASTLSLELLGNKHFYGGVSAATAEGARANYQRSSRNGQSIGLTIDARHTVSGFSDDYSGWQFASYASYQRVMMRTMVASASLFVRRDAFHSPGYSSLEYGANVGFGGELPHGVNAGLSAGASRANYDVANPFFYTYGTREDWRINARAYVGLRSIRVLGFSPSVTFTYNRNVSNVPLYDSTRVRVRFGMMKYF